MPHCLHSDFFFFFFSMQCSTFILKCVHLEVKAGDTHWWELGNFRLSGCGSVGGWQCLPCDRGRSGLCPRERGSPSQTPAGCRGGHSGSDGPRGVSLGCLISFYVEASRTFLS